MSIYQLAWAWLRLVWHNPLPFVVAVLSGAGFSFAYSYAPLHAAHDWKIGYLEARVDEQNARIEELQTQLAESAADAARRPEPGEFEALRTEFEQAQRELAGRRAAVERAERSARSLRKSRDRWRARHSAVVAELESRTAAAAAPVPAPAADFPAEPARVAASDAPPSAAGATPGEPAAAPPSPVERDPEPLPAAPEP